MLSEGTNTKGRIYRRAIRLRASPGRVVAEIEDDPHYFRVRLEHDGERLLAAEGESVRFPWTTCPAAAEPLRRLVGMSLSERCTAVGAAADARSQCTHMFDLAGLAVAHAHAHVTQGRRERAYACAVRLDADSGHTHAALSRDGEPLLEWWIDGEAVLRPAPFVGVRLHARFMAWAEQALDVDTAEAALVLRRACFVAPSRFFDLDSAERASELQHMVGRCHTFSESHVAEALRIKGSARDYTDGAEQMLGEWEEREVGDE